MRHAYLAMAAAMASCQRLTSCASLDSEVMVHAFRGTLTMKPVRRAQNKGTDGSVGPLSVDNLL